jgi:hypothetical protein
MSTAREIERGSLKTHKGVINMSDNGDGTARGRGLIVVDNSYGYMLNLTDNTWEQILDPSFPVCSHVVFLDGYFVVNEVNSGRIWLSNIYDGLNWGDIQITVQTATTLDTTIGIKQCKTNTGLDISNLTSIVLSSGYSTLSGTIISYDTATGDLSVNITSIKGVGQYHNWIIQMYSGSTAYATAESSPDNLQAIHSIHGELWLVGEQCTEVWNNSGTGVGFPFQRLHGATINNGTVARYSVQNNGSNLFWVGSSAQGHGQVWAAEGYQPQKVSTPSIDHMIESLVDISDAIGWCYTQNGHNYYVISFPAAGKTLVYDLSTDEWHERGYWNANIGKFECHRAICTAFAFDKVYVGDREFGKIYELSLDTYTDNGEIVRRVRTGPHIHSDRKRLSFSNFEVDVERGVGLDKQVDSAGTGKDPQGMLQWSDDGGFTWSNEYWKSFGAIGKYKSRLRWDRLGISRDRIFRLTVTDPAKCVLVDARADIKLSGW